jgi:hypothetical protein
MFHRANFTLKKLELWADRQPEFSLASRSSARGIPLQSGVLAFHQPNIIHKQQQPQEKHTHTRENWLKNEADWYQKTRWGCSLQSPFWWCESPKFSIQSIQTHASRLILSSCFGVLSSTSLGTLYPIYLSYKAIKNNDLQSLEILLMFWIVMGTIQTIEATFGWFLHWFALLPLTFCHALFGWIDAAPFRHFCWDKSMYKCLH